ncbi:DNA primase [Egicoccus halophilus]|uniref:DNA primase n=1 Tax=Egicoccus halophilus TaxID=1670830 RepID=A0A8J3ACV6_9ACTN|nr:DNA primase [Egicoccus halophilus]GGI09108.1 DNA primase [Egicoccus halophilus]
MAGRILKDDVEELRRQADIVAVVGDYTTLKRAGTRYKGLCPFHTERTPSFTVTPDGNFFHCFGCDASGDLYDFLMRVEGLEFPEAVEALARRSGFTLRYEELSARDRQAIGQRSRLVEVTAAALEFFRATLFSEEGEVARTYLKQRGFGRDDAERFDLGFAPMRWEALGQALTRQGLRPEDLIATGLVVRTERGGLRDRFRGRLIFPVHDPGGDVIGFGGRILPELDYGDFDPPKYLNSPETPLYKKTRVLYGVPQARAEVVRAEEVLVCEGYTDVMALHQAGFANAVATCGTAVGVEHLRMVSRYAQRVVLAFDGDAAGVKAAERAWEAARTLGGEGSEGGGTELDLRVLVLPGGRDPADLVREVGAEGLREAVADATPVVPFVLRQRLSDADLGSEAGRTAALREALGIVGLEPDLDLRREWARTEVAARIGVAYEFVVRSAQRLGVELDAHEGVAPVGPSRGTGGAGGAGGTGGVSTLDRARVRRERDVLRTALQQPQWLPDEWFELVEDDFSHPVARQVFATLTAAGGAGVELSAVLEHAADDEVRARLRQLALEDEPVPLDADAAAWRVRSLLAERLQAAERQLQDRLHTLHHGRDRDELMAVLTELRELEQRRRALTSREE